MRVLRVRPLLRKEFGSKVRPPWSHCPGLWARGFLSESGVIYNCSGTSLDDYVPDTARFIRAPEIQIRGGYLVDDKAVFWAVFGLCVPVPRLVAEIRRGVVTVFGQQTARLGPNEFVQTMGDVVIKPKGGGGGAGILVMRKQGEGNWMVNGQGRSQTQIGELLAGLDRYIVTEFVQQAQYARAIYPQTTNTLRILTMIDPDSGSSFLATAVHRFGTQRSGPADNWTRGGLSARVELETGVLGRGATYPFHSVVQWRDRHPDTGEQIAGITIPHWRDIVACLRRAAERFSFIPYLGWDVVVTDDAFVVIEVNSNTDVNLLQVHGPLMSDARVRRFYRHHGVI